MFGKSAAKRIENYTVLGAVFNLLMSCNVCLMIGAALRILVKYLDNWGEMRCFVLWGGPVCGKRRIFFVFFC